jgi:hypothetical protein
VTFIFLLAAVVASFGLLTERSVLAGFTGGPSVRVSPNTSFDIRWIASFVGTGKVEIFADPKGPGAGQPPIDTALTSGSANDHTVSFAIGGLLKADTTYYFRITHTDVSGGGNPDLTNDPVPPATDYPSVFTGAQTIGNLFVDTGVDRARILWDANVIGIGRVDYGTTSPDELSLQDQENVTDHSIELTGLAPGTTYQFRVSNRHAFDGDSLAAKTGSFTTLPSTPQVVQAIDDLRERVASYGLQRGPARSLDAKLEAALAAWETGDTAAACGALSAFLNEVRAQAGHKLTDAQAQQLTAAANDIRALIGC